MIHSLFPTTIYQSSLKKSLPPHFNKELAQEAKKFRKIDAAGELWCKKNYPGGYTSYGSLAQLHSISSSFEYLEKCIRPHVLSFSKTLDMDIRPQDLKISSLWINIMPRNVLHTMHMHPLSVISGTYYVQVPPRAAAIKFEDPRLIQFMASPPKKNRTAIQNQRFVSLSPKEGSLILFESWLKHEVPLNQSMKDRISVSFNYDWQG